jgi:hypothetical protein
LNGPTKIVACTWGWQYDYPDASAMFPPFLVSATSHTSVGGTGMSAAQLRRLGMPVTQVPSITEDADRCGAALPSQAATCWARLDQWLTSRLVAVVPFAVLQSVRIHGPRVTSFSMDQATGEFALDQLSVP